MFSSAVSAGRPANSSFERRQGGLEHALDRYLAVLHLEPGRLLGRIVLAHLRGVARGHGHRMHAIGPQGVDRDAQGQCGVHASGQPEHHAREAVLIDVVARALDQGAVDAFLLALEALRYRRATGEPYRRPPRANPPDTCPRQTPERAW